MRVCIFLLCITKLSFAQINLVKNGDFENIYKEPFTFIITPSAFSDVMEDWYMPSNGSSDVYSANVSQNYIASTHSNAPNRYGRQTPKSGNIMAGLFVYKDNTNYREYLQVQLKNPLMVGEKYVVSFNVSLAEKSEFAIKELSLSLSVNEFTNYLTQNVMSYSSILEPNEIITDVDNWVLVQDTIIANANFNYLTIGNFRNYNNTTLQRVLNDPNGNESSYYFIDDVKVYTPCELDLIVPNDTTICEDTIIQFSVNDENWDTISWNNSTYLLENDCSAGVYNIFASKKGCQYKDTFEIILNNCIEELVPETIKNDTIIPNIITPNYDGINDYFIVKGFTEIGIQIYNRWGKQVYQNVHYDNEWDAQGLVDGQYFFIIYNLEKDFEYKGWVQVLR